MSTVIDWRMTKDGGFAVRSARGNYAYAYPTSDHARMAKGRIGLNAVAKRMADDADDAAKMCVPRIVAEFNAHIAQHFA